MNVLLGNFPSQITKFMHTMCFTFHVIAEENFTKLSAGIWQRSPLLHFLNKMFFTPFCAITGNALKVLIYNCSRNFSLYHVFQKFPTLCLVPSSKATLIIVVILTSRCQNL